MLFAQAPQRTRRAFTLIELLTVVIIIGILAGLVTAAAIRVRISVRKASHALELKQLEMALHAYKERFGEFPPDDLREANWPAIRRHLSKAFPRYTVTDWATFKNAVSTGWGVVIDTLAYDQTLTFFLGGRWDGAQFTGFSANPTNPFAPGGSRIGPFFTEFDLERLVDGRYYPTVAARQTDQSLGTTNRAIRYYRAENGAYNGKGYIPFKDSRVPLPAPDNFAWINPRSFQIISPGLGSGQFHDASRFACFPDGPYDDPDNPDVGPARLEMMSNFTGGTMEDALP